MPRRDQSGKGRSKAGRAALLALALALVVPSAQAQPRHPPPPPSSPEAPGVTGPVTLHLIDDLGRPLAGARVTLSDQSTRWAAADGTVQVTATAGEVLLTADHNGAVASYTGPVVDPLCLAMTPLGNLVGTLLDAAGQPVRGADVFCDSWYVERHDAGQRTGAAVTDEWGHWLLRGMPRGGDAKVTFQRGVNAEPHSFRVWPGHTVCRLPAAQTAATTPTSLPTDIVVGDRGVPATPGHEAVVTVVLPTGRPAAGCRVYCVSGWGQSLGMSHPDPEQTDEHGVVHLQVGPGPVLLSAVTEQYHGSLAAQQTAEGLKATVRLKPTPRRAMRVQFQTRNGGDFEGGGQVLWEQEEARGGEAPLDAHGRATLFVWSDAGPVSLTLAAPDTAYLANRVLPPSLDRETVVVLPVAGCFAVTGRLLDERGQPLARTAVSLLQRWRHNPHGVAPAEATVRTDGAGRFRFERVGSWSELRLSLTDRPDALDPPPYLPPAAGPRNFGSLRLPARSAVCRAQVVDPAGRPAPGVAVLACGDGEHGPLARGRSDAQGWVTLRGLPHGQPRLLALAGRDLRAEAVVTEGEPARLHLRPWRLTAAMCREQALGCLRDAARELANVPDDDVPDDLDGLVRTELGLASLAGEEALALCEAGTAYERGATLPGLMERLAQVDPDLACRELHRLTNLADPLRRRLAQARVAAFVAPTHRAAAERLWSELAPLDAGDLELPRSWLTSFDLARARLAAELGRPEAAAWATAAGEALVAPRPAEAEEDGVGELPACGAWLAEWPDLLARFLAPLPERGSPGFVRRIRAEALARLAAVQPEQALTWGRRWFPPDGAAVAADEESEEESQCDALRCLAALRLASHDPAAAVAWAEELPSLAQRQRVWLEAARYAPDRRGAETWLGAVQATGGQPDALALAWQRWDVQQAAELAARAERRVATPRLLWGHRGPGPAVADPALSWVWVQPNAGRRWLEQRRRLSGGPLPRLDPTWAVLDPARFRSLCRAQPYPVADLARAAETLLSWAHQLDPDGEPAAETLFEPWRDEESVALE